MSKTNTKTLLFISILFFLPFEIIFSQSSYFGVWRTNSGNQQVRVTTNLSSWSAIDDDMFRNRNMRLVDFEKYEENGRDYYLGVWRSGSGAQRWSVKTSLSAWAAFDNDMVNQGLRLTDFEKYEQNGVTYYFGVWHPSSGEQRWSVKSTFNEWLSEANDFVNNRGLRLVDFEKYEENGVDYFFGVWKRGSGTQYVWAETDLSAWAARDQDMFNRGLRLVDFEYYQLNGRNFYFGVWRSGSGAQRWSVKSSLDAWSNEDNTMVNNQGLYLEDFEHISTTGSSSPPTTPSPHPSWYCSINDLMGNKAMGYSWVVLKEGRIIASDANGYAIGPGDYFNRGLRMSISTKMNIASVSKTISSVALLKLFENNLSQLDRPFWTFVGNHPQITRRPTSGIQNITLRQLLQMRAGLGINNEGRDHANAFWTQLNRTLEAPLKFTPGSRYEYNNANIAIIQAVIESVTGQSYTSYVQRSILRPMGIYGMTHTPSSRGTPSYRQNPSLQDNGYLWPTITFSTASGGWIGSSLDLARFMIGLRKNRVIKESTLNTMLRDELRLYKINGRLGTYHTHSGALTDGQGRGLNTTIVRFPDSYDAILFTNSAGINVSRILQSAFESRPNGCNNLTEQQSESRNNKSTELTANLYPNPVQQELFIKLNGMKEGKVDIKVVDLVGRVVLSKETDFNKIIQLDVRKLPKGAYLVYIKQNDIFLQEKFIKSSLNN